MFITPAFAQAAGGGAGSMFSSFLIPMVLMFAIIYFLMIRPQQKRVKEHREMVSALRRGDTVVASGGLIGKVAKVIDDNEISVELAEGVKVRMLRASVSDVRAKGEPAPSE